jgi:23S rRNA (cytosine1962-C5)-methyltransferase
MNPKTSEHRAAEPAVEPADGPSPEKSSEWRSPWVQLRTFSYHPTLYPAMIRSASPDARPGDLVQVYDKEGQPFGAGLYNPKARVPLRRR